MIELAEAEANNPEVLAGILASLGGLTVIFASNDFLAVAVQKAARLMGRSVPQDVSVVLGLVTWALLLIARSFSGSTVAAGG